MSHFLLYEPSAERGRAANAAWTRAARGMRLLGPALSGLGSQVERWSLFLQVLPPGNADHAPTGLVLK